MKVVKTYLPLMAVAISMAFASCGTPKSAVNGKAGTTVSSPAAG